jgi:hypothetical protein
VEFKFTEQLWSHDEVVRTEEWRRHRPQTRLTWKLTSTSTRRTWPGSNRSVLYKSACEASADRGCEFLPGRRCQGCP